MRWGKSAILVSVMFGLVNCGGKAGVLTKNNKLDDGTVQPASLNAPLEMVEQSTPVDPNTNMSRRRIVIPRAIEFGAYYNNNPCIYYATTADVKDGSSGSGGGIAYPCRVYAQSTDPVAAGSTGQEQLYPNDVWYGWRQWAFRLDLRSGEVVDQVFGDVLYTLNAADRAELAAIFKNSIIATPPQLLKPNEAQYACTADYREGYANLITNVQNFELGSGSSSCALDLYKRDTRMNAGLEKFLEGLEDKLGGITVAQ